MSHFKKTLQAARCEAESVLQAIPEYELAYDTLTGEERISAMIEISTRYGLVGL